MCGTGGAIGSENIAYQGIKILYKLQNRGQDAAGFGTIDHSGLEHVVKEEGLVKDIFTETALKQLPGPVGVWGTRYRTMGGLGAVNAQPHTAISRDDRYTVVCAQNGNITNHAGLRGQLNERGFFFKSENDTEVIAKTLTFYLGNNKEKEDIQAIFSACTKTIDSLVGGYIVVAAIYDRATKDHYLISFTDPRKIRPGVTGKKDGIYAVASESNALELNGFKQVRDLEAGEVFIVRRSDMSVNSKVVRQKKNKPRAYCFFEHVYMGHPNSVNEGLEGNDARSQLGRQLAFENPDLKEHTDIVMPMPFTAIPAAAGFAESIGKPLRHGVIKDRYGAGRIFLMPDHETRVQAAEENIEIVVSVVYGRRVTVIDDSIVKMNQSPPLLKKLEKAGARGVNLGITCPPIIDTCNKGIYMPLHDELGAYHKEKLKELVERGIKLNKEDLLKYKRSAAEIEALLQKEVNIPVTLRYLSLDGLLNVLTDGDKKHLVPRVEDGHFDRSVLERTRSRTDFCLNCITHEDPIAQDVGGLVE